MRQGCQAKAQPKIALRLCKQGMAAAFRIYWKELLALRALVQLLPRQLLLLRAEAPASFVVPLAAPQHVMSSGIASLLHLYFLSSELKLKAELLESSHASPISGHHSPFCPERCPCCRAQCDLTWQAQASYPLPSGCALPPA